MQKNAKKPMVDARVQIHLVCKRKLFIFGNIPLPCTSLSQVELAPQHATESCKPSSLSVNTASADVGVHKPREADHLSGVGNSPQADTAELQVICVALCMAYWLEGPVNALDGLTSCRERLMQAPTPSIVKAETC